MFRTLNKSSLIVPAMTLTLAVGLAQASASVIFEDHMDNLNNWTANPASGISLITSDTTVDHEPYMKTGNVVAWAEIGKTISKDWTLTYKVRLQHNQRGMYVGLLNEAGTQGYLAEWNTANSPNDNTFVRIRKYNLNSAYTTWDQGTESDTVFTLTNAKYTGHAWSDDHFADFTFSWDADAHTLTLSVDGAQQLQVVDSDFDTFSRIYVRGQTDGQIDDVKLTAVPEPGSLALLGLGGAMLLSRKRRR